MGKKKPRGKPFTKGHRKSVGNKSKKGQLALDVDELSKRAVDKELFDRYVRLNSHLTVKQLKERLSEENITVWEYRIIQALIGQGSKFTNLGGITFSQIVDRCVGPVAQKTIHAVEDPFAGKSTEELEQMARELEKANRETVTYLERSKGLRDVSPTTTIESTTVSESTTPNPNGIESA